MRGSFALPLAFAFALALLAGCVSPATQVQPAAVDAKALGAEVGSLGVLSDAARNVIPLPAGVTRLVGGEYVFPASATEPSIGADKAGDVFMTGQGMGALPGRSSP